MRRYNNFMSKKVLIFILVFVGVIIVYSYVNKADITYEQSNFGESFDLEEILDSIEFDGRYSVSDYPYSEQRKAAKVIKLYDEALQYDGNWIYLEKETKFHLIPGVTSFKQTTSSAAYIYYGGMKKGKPNGLGIVFKYEYRKGGYVVHYMGNFKKGALNGYGIEIANSIDYDYSVLYEGEWKNGLHNGEGKEYFPLWWNIEVISDNGWESFSLVDADYEDNTETLTDTQISEFQDDGRNHIIDIQVGSLGLAYEGKIKNGKYSGKGCQYYLTGTIKYEGRYKKGLYSGKGKEYYLNGILKYEGKFKNGLYNGKGKLYAEDGTLKYKGKFRKGDIK